MYDTAALTSGYTLEDPNSLSQRLHRLVASSLDIDPNFQVEEEEFPEEKIEEPATDAEAKTEEEKEDL